jgi:hypothetical protein
MTGTWQGTLQAILTQLSGHQLAQLFTAPVDPHQVPDYLQIIKNPMDLGTAAQKLRSGQYPAMLDCTRDVRFIWSNCRMYNQPGSGIIHYSNALSIHFDRLLARFADRVLHLSQRADESDVRRTENDKRLQDAAAQPPPLQPLQ